jgi:hypothetical protein
MLTSWATPSIFTEKEEDWWKCTICNLIKLFYILSLHSFVFHNSYHHRIGINLQNYPLTSFENLLIHW